MRRTEPALCVRGISPELLSYRALSLLALSTGARNVTLSFGLKFVPQYLSGLGDVVFIARCSLALEILCSGLANPIIIFCRRWISAFSLRADSLQQRHSLCMIWQMLWRRRGPHVTREFVSHEFTVRPLRDSTASREHILDSIQQHAMHRGAMARAVDAFIKHELVRPFSPVSLDGGPALEVSLD